MSRMNRFVRSLPSIGSEHDGIDSRSNLNSPIGSGHFGRLEVASPLASDTFQSEEISSPFAYNITDDIPQKFPAEEEMGSDLKSFFLWLYAFCLMTIKNLVLFINEARDVLSVPTFVTGFWQEAHNQKYRLGPVPVENAFGPLVCDDELNKEQCREVYVLIDEEQIYFRHSLWPKLDLVSAFYAKKERKFSLDNSCSESEYLREDAYYGLPHHATPTQAQRFVYAALLPVRALCLAFVQLGNFISPRPFRLVVGSKHISVPVPDKTYRNLAKLQILLGEDDAEWDVPFWVVLAAEKRIEGRAALNAARRAGWNAD